MTLRAQLRLVLSERFIPALKKRGFSGPDRLDGAASCHNFTRPRGRDIEFVVIQFDKRKSPRFIINLWIEPPGGSEEIIRTKGIWMQGRVAPNRGVRTGQWFRADRPWWQRLIGNKTTLESDAVDQALSFLDAIEDWFREPRNTPAVRTLRFDWSTVKNEHTA